jgi:two-component system OmpR family sensor kinase
LVRTLCGVRKVLARLSVRNWSLRARLVAGVVGLVAVALVTTGTIGVALLRSYLVHQVDQQLAVGVVAASRAPTGRPAPSALRTGEQLPTPFVFADLAADGTVLRERGGSLGGDDPKPVLSGLDSAAVRREGDRAFTVPSTRGGSGFRVRVVERAGGSGAAFGVLVALAAIAAVAVRIGLRPLVNVERTAEEIAAGDLSRRVPPGPGGTELGRLARTLNAMFAQIEEALAARTRSETALRQFIADASHELRTPLTTVRGYAELARKGAFPDAAAEQRAMGRVEAEASRMGVLVDDLLLLAYLDQERPLHPTKVDLHALTAEAVADARVRAPGRPIDYTAADHPLFVDVDADRIRQVLANLLGNALTHTPDGTPVHVFERFYRVDGSRTRARGGSGLGLAIVQAIVRASRGSVSCTSAPGRGTSFVVTLPVHI